jgi:hypothetical protein
MPWLDVCTSLEQWLLLSGIKDGLLFKALSGGYDRIDLNKNKKMSAGVFLLNFRHNLMDVPLQNGGEMTMLAAGI